ncbi:hypothetical protein F2Q68_00021761 [Brassica cretica]|uniref:Uncharacterized protein n=1 Tax=Brassica cretica TaxID=69181 RepID=A0A8S9FZU9_BRACR|nr:hypothetical protein F2Q68_00021761 [Brassica cretica]
MDPNEERRSMKAHKARYDSLHFVTDSMQGIQERCVCGKRLLRERAPAEVYDYLPGKRFFTCKSTKQPWVCAVEEELQIRKTRLEKCEEHKSLVVKLEVENQELKAEVEKLIARVSELEPPGIKAAKAAKKKKGGQEESFIELKTVLEMKDKLNKQKLLEKLLEKPEPLYEMEMTLKLKLMWNRRAWEQRGDCYLLLFYVM